MRYSNGFGSCFVFATLNGSNASIGTIHGLIDVPRFLAKKGPKGTYSHFCISLQLKINSNY